MLVKDLMNQSVVTIDCRASVRDALNKMSQQQVKSLVVEKRHANDAYGIVTYSTIVKTIIAEQGDIDLLNVYDIATKPVVTVGQDLAVNYVAQLMINMKIKRVVVIDNNEMLGLLTMHDLVTDIMNQIKA
jgi:signal-transduction protein with cAMP-binding, CBS, and nucleotidyltransferase domain